jgi:DNA-binding NtrC family response regulator
MIFVLVVSQKANFRRLCVDNLVIRGHLAVGIASAEEGKKLLQQQSPDLVLLCSDQEHSEVDLYRLRASAALANVPVVLVSTEKPDPTWVKRWHISSYIPYPLDARTLVDILQPWLHAEKA